MIKVKIISMARKPKRNHEAYGWLGFLLPKQKELNNANIEQDVELVRCDTRVGPKRK